MSTEEELYHRTMKKSLVLLQINDTLTSWVVFIAGKEKNLLASLLYPIKE